MENKLRVLFVEDSGSDAGLIVHRLELAGYVIDYERVETVDEMKNALQEHSWDLILSDYNMPQFDVADALSLYREMALDIPFIILSNAISDETAVALMKAGAHDYLMKDQMVRLIPVVALELNEAKIRSEKRLAVEALVQTEKRYRSFFEHDITGNYLSTTEGQLIDCNPAFVKMLGYESYKELSVINIAELFADPAEHDIIVAHLKNDKNLEVIESELIRKDGQRISCVENITGIFGQDGALEHFHGNLIDITERKKAQEFLVQSKARLIRGESVSKSGNWELHLDSGMITASEGAQKLYGIKGEQWSFETIKKIPLPKYRVLLEDALLQLVKHNVPYDLEFKIRQPNTGQIIDIKSIAEYDSHQRIIFGVIQDITDRKNNEIELINRESKYRELANSLPVSVYETDLTGKIIFVNATALDWFGYTEEDVSAGFNIIQFVAESDHSSIAERFSRIITQDINSTNEYTVKRKDGSFFPVLISSFAVKKDGVIVGVRGTVVDISERKRAETKLKESERTLTNLIGNLPGFVYRCKNDKDWTMEYLSDGFSTITGYLVDDILEFRKLTYKDIIHPDYRNYLWEQWQIWLGLKSSLEEEYPIITKCGEIRWVWERGRGVYDDNNSLIYREGFVTDITERKHTDQIQKVLYNISTSVLTTQNLEELIEIIRNELGNLLDTSNFYVAFYDEAAGVFHSPHAVDQKDELSSWSAEKSLTDYLIKQKKALLISEEEFQRLVDGGEVQSVGATSKLWLGVPLREEEKIIGALVVQSYDNPKAYNSKDVEMLEFISHQISLFVQRKRAESELKFALVKAEESDRLKSAFLANMNHELRTPLNHILGFSELILSGVMSEDNQSFASSIHTSGKNLLAIVEDIFDLALAEQANVKLRLQTFRLMDQFMEIKSSFDHILQGSGKAEQIQLIFKPDIRLLSTYLSIDRSKVNQILINLFKNAVKFTNDGTIEFGYQSIEPGKLTFFIKDTGIGIPKEKQAVIFDFFRQGDDSPTRIHGGIGVGLAIALKIAKILKGELSVVSEPYKGSAFYLTIPVELSDISDAL